MVQDFKTLRFDPSPSRWNAGTFCLAPAYQSAGRTMKAFLPSRPELRWVVVAIPALFLAHWVVTTVGHRLLGVVPDSLRAVLHLL